MNFREQFSKINWLQMALIFLVVSIFLIGIFVWYRNQVEGWKEISTLKFIPPQIQPLSWLKEPQEYFRFSYIPKNWGDPEIDYDRVYQLQLYKQEPSKKARLQFVIVFPKFTDVERKQEIEKRGGFIDPGVMAHQTEKIYGFVRVFDFRLAKPGESPRLSSFKLNCQGEEERCWIEQIPMEELKGENIGRTIEFSVSDPGGISSVGDLPLSMAAPNETDYFRLNAVIYKEVWCDQYVVGHLSFYYHFPELATPELKGLYQNYYKSLKKYIGTYGAPKTPEGEAYKRAWLEIAQKVINRELDFEKQQQLEDFINFVKGVKFCKE